MPDLAPYPHCLVVHRGRPGLVRHVGKTLSIELQGGETLNVRPKDVVVLHPGPVERLDGLDPPPGEVLTAWELLAGSTTTLAELAELAFGAYTPPAAWACWQLLADGLYFSGSPDQVVARTPEQVAHDRAAREARLAEERAWAAFLERARAGQVAAEDRPYLGEVADLALGRRERSRALRALGRAESSEAAHALLLELGHWDPSVDPYPARMGVTTTPVALDVPPLPEGVRTDLTHLPAFAIDDEGNQEPDDALSLEGRRLWVHVADVSALIPPDSPLDLEARARATALYLPEGTVPMIPWEAIQALGLGLAEVSPALSFGLDLDKELAVCNVEVVPSWVRVQRLTYPDVDARLDEPPFDALWAIARAHEARRRSGGAVRIDLPEVKITVHPPAEGEVSAPAGARRVTILPLPPLRSRELVAESMIMAGSAVARLAQEQGLPLPFTAQEPPGSDDRPTDLSGMVALRQTLRPSQYSTIPGPHAGLGLPEYAQATSPMRRYLDLVVHQQLRAWLAGEGTLDSAQILERVGAAMAVSGAMRQAERLARRHWTLVFLLQNPDWEGEGILVDVRGRRGTVLIPSLDLETQVHLRRDLPLNSVVPLSRPAVRLAELMVRFQGG